MAFVVLALISATLIYLRTRNLAPEDSSAATVVYKDERFAVSGGEGKRLGQMLGYKWWYNWGVDVYQHYKFGSVIFQNGQNNLLLVADPGFGEAECPNHQPHYGTDGKPDCGGYHLLDELARDFPGSYYALGNEPDLNFFIHPETYADWYHAFATEILRLDPTAKITNGGVYYPDYKFDVRAAASNDYRHNALMNPKDSDPTTPDMSALLANATNPSIVKSAAWLHYFREYYKAKYGSYPPHHFWNIHLYPSNYEANQTLNPITEAKGYLDSFRTYMNYIGEADKPLWVTEFAVLWEPCGPVYPTPPGITPPQVNYVTECNAKAADEPYNQVAYMQNMVAYFVSGNKVQKWFWYSIGEEKQFNSFLGYRDHSSQIFINESTKALNTMANTYATLETINKDATMPVISTATIQATGGAPLGKQRYTMTLAATDPGSGIVEYRYALGTASGSSDILGWQSKLTTSGQFSATMEINSTASNFYVTLQVEDAAGNMQTRVLVNGNAATITALPTLPNSTPTVTPTSVPDGSNACLPMDINADDKLAIADLANFAVGYPKRTCDPSQNKQAYTCGLQDSNGDGKMTIVDFVSLAQRYNRPGCAL